MLEAPTFPLRLPFEEKQSLLRQGSSIAPSLWNGLRTISVNLHIPDSCFPLFYPFTLSPFLSVSQHSQSRIYCNFSIFQVVQQPIRGGIVCNGYLMQGFNPLTLGARTCQECSWFCGQREKVIVMGKEESICHLLSGSRQNSITWHCFYRRVQPDLRLSSRQWFTQSMFKLIAALSEDPIK